jgi:tight adherence protein B
MDPSTVQTLLLLAAFLLASAAVAAVVALQLQKQQKRIDDRIAFVTETHFPTATREIVRRTARRQTETVPVMHRLARIFGYDPTRKAQYPVKWWVILPASLLVARVLAALLAPLVGWIAMAAIPGATVLLSRWFYKICNDRRARLLFVQFPDALSTIVRGVRVGIPVRESMLSISRESPMPTCAEFQRVSERISLGAPLEEALYEMADRNPLPEYRFFATAIGLQAQTGGGLSETLENLADVIRRRVALRARAYALASEARTSIVILCALPIVTGIVISVLNPEYIAILFTTDSGRKVLAAAVISFSVGLAAMKYIVKKSLS